jgi:dipeptidyl-peptidase III
MKNLSKWLLLLLPFFIFNCSPKEQQEKDTQAQTQAPEPDDFQYKTDQFADLQILRYRVPDFEKLTLEQKKLVYYLSQAGLSGRDIIYDQNYKHNLTVRRIIEQIVEHYEGDRNSQEFEAFMTYAKRVWFSNGIHHHYSTRKIMPDFSEEYFAQLIENSPKADFPTLEGEEKEDLLARITPVIFDPNEGAKRVNLTRDIDNVLESANNFYEGVTEAEVEAFYARLMKKDDPQPPLYGLNSKLMKENGEVIEKPWKVGGMYTEAIEQIVFWLEKASEVAENKQQKKAIDLLIKYYETGDLKDFDAYNIAWVKDTASVVDMVNGFIEVYGDAIGYRGSYESVVSIKDFEASARLSALQDNAQWFEDHSPLQEEHKKEKVTGISYKVINVVSEAGDAAPATPIGINLPNSPWIRKEHGSKSVSLGNIKDAYTKGSSGGALEEFAYDEEEIERSKKYSTLAANLHTALHEVIGHASGQLNPGVGNPSETLKTYASALEEARADLVALYFLMDEKLVDIGVMPSLEVGKAEYDSYIRNGLFLQLRRLKEGEEIEEAHMRNRQLVAGWAYEKGKPENVIERKQKNGKTYFEINDYEKLRGLFGELLKEIQRIKSEGDLAAGEHLIETYGVEADQELVKEVKKRYAKLENAPYSGFIQPRLVAQKDGDEITDVRIEYPDNFVEQMMRYGKEYSFLPEYN